jgi:hypothetical protein
MVVVVPAGSGWSVRSHPPVDVEGVALAEAVRAAEALVAELREFGLPTSYQAERNTAVDQPRD